MLLLTCHFFVFVYFSRSLQTTQAERLRNSVKDLRDHIQTLRADRHNRLERALKEFTAGILDAQEYRMEKQAILEEMDPQIAQLEGEVRDLLNPDQPSGSASTPGARTIPRRRARSPSPDWDEDELERDINRATSPALPAAGM